MKITNCLSLAILCFLVIVSCSSDSPTATVTLTTYQLDVSADPVEAGNVTPASDEYDEGETVEVTATANEDWVFVEWQGDLTGTTNPVSLTMDSDKDITALFIKREFPLTINIEGEGTVSESILQLKTTEYQAGTTVELTASSASGWVFVEWQGDLTGSVNPEMITIDGAKEVTAVFEEAESFYLADNGVTVICDAADVGESGIVSGITYTKRRKSQIRPNNAETTCTSGITEMRHLFLGDDSFNGDISSWDVSSVTDMREMFYLASSFNGDIGSWDVSSVTRMYYTFRGASSFNGDISGWDVSSVSDIRGMFYFATDFNVDIGGWDISSVTNLDFMFQRADSFNQDLSEWDVSPVRSMLNTFRGASSFNGDISSWDVSSVTDMRSVFRDASEFNGDISGWDVSSATRTANMFSGSNSFNQNIGDWDVSSVTNMNGMFQEALNFNQDISNWCVSHFNSEPNDFATDSALTEENKPVWGTCPGD